MGDMEDNFSVTDENLLAYELHFCYDKIIN